MGVNKCVFPTYKKVKIVFIELLNRGFDRAFRPRALMDPLDIRLRMQQHHSLPMIVEKNDYYRHKIEDSSAVPNVCVYIYIY